MSLPPVYLVAFSFASQSYLSDKFEFEFKIDKSRSCKNFLLNSLRSLIDAANLCDHFYFSNSENEKGFVTVGLKAALDSSKGLLSVPIRQKLTSKPMSSSFVNTVICLFNGSPVNFEEALLWLGIFVRLSIRSSVLSGE